MAPEILREASGRTPNSDIFSLGMTMMEVVTSRVPWSSDRDHMILYRLINKKIPPRPKEISGDSLWNLLVGCWHYEPEARPSALYVLEAMQNMPPDSIIPPDTEPDASQPQEELPQLGIPSEAGAVMISRNMPLPDVVSHLVARGCRDLSGHIDESAFDPLPSLGGGSGDIYFGNLLDSTPVCVKVARFTSDITRRAKSQVYASREIHTWNKCNHPNILPFLGLAVFRERIAIVSPWIKNGTMRDFLKEHPDTDRCRLSTQICDGIIYLHNLNIVHGDLKGENVLISDDGDVLLADFGSADLTNRTITFTQFLDQIGWTMRWGAPELLREIVPRSKEADVYALGMTILEAITGKSPFAGKKEMAVMLAVCFKQELPARPIDSIPPTSEHGERLWELLCRCWSHEIENRPNATKVGSIMRTITKEGLLEAK
ncbi:kinase-like domain-containing protein [Rhizoctonia solani]|nr:kinase-like domain-containing protein [Rhizoctonia solani]